MIRKPLIITFANKHSGLMNPSDFRPGSPGRVIRTLRGYWAFVPDPLPPSIAWSERLIAALSQADRSIGELAGLGHFLPNPHLLAHPFVRQEAVFSSRIEGTRASLSDLYAYESGQSALFALPDDVREVHNYVRALEYGLQRMETLPVSLRLIREIHGVLMEGVRGRERTPGVFRRSQNWIGRPGSTLNTATFVPPPVEEMWRALDALEKFLHAPSSLPPVLRVGLVHYQFETIHPFLDGNGRVGRLLIILLLYAWGVLPAPLLYLSPYFEMHRQTYYDLLLRVSRQGDWEAWLIFFLQGVAVQSRDALRRIRRLEQLRREFRSRLETTRAPARLLKVVDLLFRRPILQNRDVTAALDVNFSTAQRYIDRLVETGILREMSGQTRNRVYRADEILSVLSEASPQETIP